MKSIYFVLAIMGLMFFQFVGNVGNILRRKFFCQRGSSTPTEGNYLSDIVKLELELYMSREQVTVKSGENLVVGQVLGKIKLGAAPTTGTAVSGNTGAGTMTGVTAGAKAKSGTYTVKCINIVTGSGVFSVADPDGEALPDAVVGAYVNDQINFTLNDGSPDFAVGDTFAVVIAAGSGQAVGIDVAALDGSQDPYGILIANCDASLAATQAVAIVRDARIIEANLIWLGTSPDATVAQIAAAMAKFHEVGIIPIGEA